MGILEYEMNTLMDQTFCGPESYELTKETVKTFQFKY